MIRTDKPFTDAVERTVREAERGTSAELVVVLAARSGSYLDVALIAAASAASAFLLVALFAPFYFPPIAVAVEVPAIFALVTWLTNRTPALLRRLAGASRAGRHVERAAAAWFLDEAVHGTRAHTGLLVYISILEERAAIVPDLGLGAAIPEAVWAGIAWRESGGPDGPRSGDDVLRGVAAIGAILRERLPAAAADVNEFPDAPRIAP